MQGFKITQVVDWHKKKTDRSRVVFKIELPGHFPKKYEGALGKVVETCLVAKLGKGLDDDSFTTVISWAEN